jgi:hypothetical protein
MKNYYLVLGVLGLFFIIGCSFLSCNTLFGKDLNREQSLKLLKTQNIVGVTRDLQISEQRRH